MQTMALINQLGNLPMPLLMMMLKNEYNKYDTWRPLIAYIDDHQDLFKSFIRAMLSAAADEQDDE